MAKKNKRRKKGGRRKGSNSGKRMQLRSLTSVQPKPTPTPSTGS